VLVCLLNPSGNPCTSKYASILYFASNTNKLSRDCSALPKHNSVLSSDIYGGKEKLLNIHGPIGILTVLIPDAANLDISASDTHVLKC